MSVSDSFINKDFTHRLFMVETDTLKKRDICGVVMSNLRHSSIASQES